MPAAVTFYDPIDTTGILDTMWEIQTAVPSPSSTRAAGPKSTGDEAKSHLHNAKITYVVTAICYLAEGELVLPSVGTVSVGGIHVDSVNLKPDPNGWPVLTLNCHKHNGGSSHAAGSCRLYTPSITFNAGFGVDRAGIGFTLAAGDTAIGIASVEYNLTCTHDDTTGDLGDWLAGENRDGVETFKLTTTGSGATVTPPVDAVHPWDKTGGSTPMSSTSADSETFDYEHHISFSEEP